jgi:hypothetical protein
MSRVEDGKDKKEQEDVEDQKKGKTVVISTSRAYRH